MPGIVHSISFTPDCPWRSSAALLRVMDGGSLAEWRSGELEFKTLAYLVSAALGLRLNSSPALSKKPWSLLALLPPQLPVGLSSSWNHAFLATEAGSRAPQY